MCNLLQEVVTSKIYLRFYVYERVVRLIQQTAEGVETEAIA